METNRGSVSGLEFGVEFSESDDNNTTTWYVAKFELNGKPTIYRSLSRGEVHDLFKDGDELIVAGKTEDKLFRIWAYRNLTTNTASHPSERSPRGRALGIILSLIGLAAFVVLGVLGARGSFKSIPNAYYLLWLLFVAGLTLIVLGVVFLRSDKNQRDAIKAIYYGGHF